MRRVIRAWDWQTDDIEALTHLLHRAYAGLLAQGLHFTATDQSRETTQRRMEGGHPFLIELDGQVIGTMTLSYPVRHWDNDPVYYGRPGVALLSQFGLEPAYQGQGYGREMFDHAVAWCLGHGCSEFCVDTSDQALHLIQMYEHWGFRVVAAHRWQSVNYSSVVMALDLLQPIRG